MSVPCTALLYDSTAATRTLKLSTTLLSISSGIRLIPFLMMSSLAWGLFWQTLFLGAPSENSQAGWDLGNRMARGYRFDAKWISPMGSYAWGILVFCSVREMSFILTILLAIAVLYLLACDSILWTTKNCSSAFFSSFSESFSLLSILILAFLLHSNFCLTDCFFRV